MGSVEAKPASVGDERLRCAACGDDQPAGPLFCRRCTAPLGVAALCDLADEDLRLALHGLLETLGEAMRQPRARLEDDALWRAYLSAFWLRPETALVLYGEALAARALGTDVCGPWLDLGCGDGIHASIRHGWRFAPGFDAFQCLDPGAADIYNHWDPARFEARIERRGEPIGWGVDIKPTAVARCRALGTFGEVLQADATALPMPDGSVGAIFSNMLRDLGEPLPGALRSCRRVLADDGRLLISTMTPQYRDSLYFYSEARRAEATSDLESARRMLRLDRGRSVFCQRQLSAEEWDHLLREQGLRVHRVEPTVGPDAIRFWDTGLRAFSTRLLQQRESWTQAGALVTVKATLCALLDYLIRPLAERRLDGGEPCMLLLDVRKA